jgi:methylmalonyl-CoA/ethylmalonyl-CoA epimerase
MNRSELPLDHVGVAVASIAEALPLFRLITGGQESEVEAVPAQGVNVAFIGAGAGRLELIEPDSGTSNLHKHLERRGPGLHHLAYRVPDIEAELARLAAAGIQLIDPVARPGAHGHRVAFLHPRDTGGVLIELVE